MTGSSSKIPHAPSATTIPHAPSATTIPHAPSAQWLELLGAAAERRRMLFADQPEIWWRDQSERLASVWTQAGLPTTRLEDWKYTSLVALHAKARRIGLGPVDVRAPEGVKVLRLSELNSNSAASPETKTRVRELLTETSNVYFENLARTLVADPFVVLIPDGLKSETPVEIDWRSLPEGQWGFGAAAILVGKNADVSLIERYGKGVDAQTQSTSIDVGGGALVSHLRIQQGDGRSESLVFSSVRTKLRAGAKYESTQVSFGSQLSREDLTVELCEAEAEAIVDGVFIGRDRQVLDHHTNLVHRVGNTVSRQLYKGILSDESRGIFNGRVAISKNASGSNSAQMNKNLLLSKKVELDTKPQLEIDNDDVKAAHGAAIGRLDADHVFYLRSRGISEAQAIEMLARGFAFEAMERLSDARLRKIGISEAETALRGLKWDSL